uniref:Heat shock 70 kDa protein 12A-like n=1 Tax=Crassostrea virginica TaxID=6565 RepID=A0A8B8B0Z1_CRAVI|nr:heat shock 70 kDa protein 12A-like [Crassostrea virginica]XP_022296997.1 heat shock 70 kDa protein 12A-like [Crassostrea virginica]
MATKNYLLVAAIDFGTTYSGYAFSTRTDFQREPTKAYLKQWVDPASSMMYNKTSTCILFDESINFSKFGFEAEVKYLDLIMDDEHKSWYFFRHFKMSLYDKQSRGDVWFIEDETGKQLPALIVFCESLKFLKQSLLEEAKKQQTDIGVDDIKWILTVPAIWSDPAKAFMRRAAVEAGIDSNMLTIALEPEAAAIFVKHLPVDRRLDGEGGDLFKTFAPGSKYIVVDAGGGTIDITAHEVLNDGNVREIIKSNGGNWGGTSVDRVYLDFIKCLIGESVTQSIQQNEPNLFFEVCRNFETAKRTIKPQSDMKFNVRIPSQLGEAYSEMFPGKDLRSKMVVLTKDKRNVSISFVGDKLRLAPKDAEGFFAESIYEITRHLKSLLRQPSGRGVATIILVGGFAESPMFIQGIKSAFPEMRVIIPLEAAWSVLRGAVIFGHDPSLIRERRSKYTYGIGVYDQFDPTIHDEKYKYEEDGETRCGSLFSKLISIDDPVSVGEYRAEREYFLTKIGYEGNLELYTSVSPDPKYVDEKGCSFVGYILTAGHGFLVHETVNVMMRFGETEVEIKAHQPKTNKTAIYYLGQ